MSEPYKVGGRTFTPGERCLVRAFWTGWQPAVVAPYDQFCGVRLVAAVRCDSQRTTWYWAKDVLLLSENFAPPRPAPCVEWANPDANGPGTAPAIPSADVCRQDG